MRLANGPLTQKQIEWVRQAASVTVDARGRETFEFDSYGIAALCSLAADDKSAEVSELRDVLRRNGFVECRSSACNCGSWHALYSLPECMAPPGSGRAGSSGAGSA